MGKLIIDGNSMYEIDEECMKKRKPSTACDIEKYFPTMDESTNSKREEKIQKEPSI